jgi:RHS repeat-associated protein
MNRRILFSKILNVIVGVSILLGLASPVAAMPTSTPTSDTLKDSSFLKKSAYDSAFFDPTASSLVDLFGGDEDSLLFGSSRQVPLEPLPHLPSRPSSSISQPQVTDPLSGVSAVLSQLNGAGSEKSDPSALASALPDAKSHPSPNDPFAFIRKWFALPSNSNPNPAGQTGAQSRPTVSPTTTAPVSPTISSSGAFFLYLPVFLGQSADGSETATLQPDQKSSVSFADGNVKLSAPTGFFSQTVIVKYRALSHGSVAGHPHLLRSFEMTAQAGGVPVSHFEASLTFTLQYADQLGLDESLLHLFYLDPKRNVWVGVPSVVDTMRNRVTATVDHFTTFALMDVTTCGELTWDGLPVELQPVFLAACDRVGGLATLGQPTSSAFQWFGAWNVDFENGSLIYNVNKGIAYYVSWELQDKYISASGPSGWLGLPIGDTIPGGPPNTYQDEYHDFRNHPYVRFEHGFIGINDFTSEVEAHRYFPQIINVYKVGEYVEVGQDINDDPIYMLQLTFSAEVDPAPNSTATAEAGVLATIYDGEGNLIDEWSDSSIVGPSSVPFEYPYLLPLDAFVEFHFQLDRLPFSTTDDLIGYARCLYFVEEQPYGPMNVAGDFSKAVGCGAGIPGAGGEDPVADTTPPVIHNLDLTPLSGGGYYAETNVTDNMAVDSVALIFNGASYSMKSIGTTLYGVVIPSGPLSGSNTFKVYAVDTSGNEAWFPSSGNPFSVPAGQGYHARNYGAQVLDCSCPPGYMGGIGDPVNTFSGNFTHSYVDSQVLGLGDTDITIARTHNSAAALNGDFGLGGGTLRFTEDASGSVQHELIAGPPHRFGPYWSSPFDVTLIVLDNSLIHQAQVFYPDGRVVTYLKNGDGTFTPETPFSFDTLIASGSGYELLHKNTLESELFDAEGHLVGRRDRNGNEVTYTYNGDQLVSIENASGRTITLENNAEGYIIDIHLPENINLHYGYQDGDLVSFTDGRGKINQYAYTDHHQLEQVLTPKSHPSLRMEYDDQGRVKKQIVGETETYTFDYSADGSLTTLTDNYHTIKHHYDDEGRLIQSEDSLTGSEYYGYDDHFNRNYLKDRNNNEYHYTFDDHGNLLTEDGPLSSHREFEYNDLNQPTHIVERIDADTDRETTFAYDTRGNLIEICNALDECSSFTYDGRGLLTDISDFSDNPTHNTYNSAGDLISVTDAETQTTDFGYDSLGRTISMQTPLDYTYTYTYDGNDNLTDVDGPLGFHLGYRYDDNDNLEVVIDPNDGETLYSYDKSENVVTVTNQLAFTTATYTYGPMNELTGFRDAEEHNWTYDHKDLLRVTDIHGPLETHTHFEYDAVGNVTDVTDAEERTTHTDYDALNRPTAITLNYRPGVPANADTNVTMTYEYNLVGDVLRMVDPEDNPTVYEYDLLSRMMLKRTAEDQAWEYEYDPMGNLTLFTNPRQYDTVFGYDDVYRLETVTDAKENVTTFHYDKDGNRTDVIDPDGVVTHFEYNELDRLTDAIRNYRPGQPADSQTNVMTSYDYDLAGNVRFVTEPRNFQSEFRYDAAMRLVETVDYENAHTVMTYDKVNNLLTVTDDNDHTTIYEYDDLNRRTSVTNPEMHTVTFAYNKVGDLIELVDANQNRTQYEVDALGRVTRIMDALQGEWLYDYNRVGKILTETDANDHATTYTFDKVYRLLSSTDAEDHTTSFQWDPNDNLVELIDGNDHHTFYGYDELDRLASTKNPEDETTRYGYDALGNQTELIEADDTITRYGYDPLYRLVSVTENYVAGGSSNDDTNVVTNYGYDASSNLTRFINANSAVTQFEYDGMGRLLSEIDPLTNTWTYTYDGVGNRLTRRDANGKLTTYSYYPDDQSRRIDYENGTSVAFTYDPNNNRTVMQDSLGTTTWTYDALNRVTNVVDPFNRTLHSDYDPVSNRTGLTYPDGNLVSYTYYKNNWLKTMLAPEGNVTSYERDGVGNLTHISNPNSTVTDLTYDKADRVRTLTNRQIGGANKTNSAYAYSYNKVGHVTQIVNTYGWRQPDTVTEEYIYDGLHRLAGMQNTEGVSMSYAYDKVGNRKTWTTNDDLTSQTPLDGFTATYAYNAANQLLSVGVVGDEPIHDMTVTFRYDANGNRISKEWDGPQAPPVQGVDYTYDPENRLIVAQDYQLDADNRVDRAITMLAYDGDGRRLVQTYDPKTDNGGQKRIEYTFDGLDSVAEYDLLNGQRDNFYRGADGRIETMHHFPAGTPGQMFWYDYNFKGDIVGLTKQDGQSIHNYRYDPYGGVVPDNGNFTDPHNHYTLTGKEFDENTGLIYFGARHYDPKMGVWVTQDIYRGILSSPLSFHRYIYNYDSPINYVDRYGYSGEYTFKHESTLITRDELIKIQDQVQAKIKELQNPPDYNDTAEDLITTGQDLIYTALGTVGSVVSNGVNLCNIFLPENKEIEIDADTLRDTFPTSKYELLKALESINDAINSALRYGGNYFVYDLTYSYKDGRFHGLDVAILGYGGRSGEPGYEEHKSESGFGGTRFGWYIDDKDQEALTNILKEPVKNSFNETKLGDGKAMYDYIQELYLREKNGPRYELLPSDPGYIDPFGNYG